MNISNYYQEWDLDKLPWDAVTPVPPVEVHPELFDRKLMDAINERVLPSPDEMPPKSHGAALAFLYLYMSLTHGDEEK